MDLADSVESVHASPTTQQTSPSSPHQSPLTLDGLLKHTPILTFILDAECRIEDVSQSYLDRFECGHSDLVGRHVYEYFDAEEGQAHALETTSITNAIESAIKTGKVNCMAGIVARRDKSTWKFRAIPIVERGSQSLLNIVLEMEEQQPPQRKTSQEMSQKTINAAETYRILVETVRDYAIFMLDTKGRVATWNLGAELMKGYKREEIVGRHFSNFYGLEDRIAKKPQKELKWALRDGRVEDEGWRYRKDGSRFWANVMITPVYRDGELIGFSKVTRDLTQRKADEASVIAAYEESARLKSEFLANMSHEIRTPMHGMVGALNLLKDTHLTPDQVEYSNILNDSVGVLLQVINNILDYSKLTSGSLPIAWERIDIGDIITSVTKSIETTLKNDSLAISTSLSPDLPDTVLGDTLRYRQILQNLVDNAVKFTERGDVVVTASVDSDQEHDLVIRTEVSDTGIGIPSEAAESLFSPFTQADGSATKRYKGTGLGLSICKSLSELMGGEIGYRPNPSGQGSVFWFTTKFRKPDHYQQGEPDSNVESARETLDALTFSSSAHPQQTEPASPSSSASIPASDLPTHLRSLAPSKHLLLVEDNPLNQRVMLRTLSSLGFPPSTVDAASNGNEALNLVARHGNGYDLILMDISMPQMDGVEATQEIRKLGVQTPIVAMTANALVGQREGYLNSGLTDYLSKPVERERLIEVLGRWLGM